ncbi:sulfotransferase [Micromonospora sp. M12]
MAEPAPRTAPIFLVGCQRSGTTMVRLVLDSHSRISCGLETRFLPDLRRIVGRDWERLARFGFPREDWLRRIRDFFGGVHADYAAARARRGGPTRPRCTRCRWTSSPRSSRTPRSCTSSGTGATWWSRTASGSATGRR